MFGARATGSRLVNSLLAIFIGLPQRFRSLERSFEEIRQAYALSIRHADNDIREAGTLLQKWHDGDKVTRVLCTEDELNSRVKQAYESKHHEELVHEKFLRGRERFLNDRRRLRELLAIYGRYLLTKIGQARNGAAYTRALGAGAVTFEEFLASARETKITLEESERKLDVLLGKHVLEEDASA